MENVNDQRLAEMKATLNSLPRVSLATLPTPLELCPGLTRELKGPEIWIKRDDLTGLAMGGNKTRMYEYVLGQAIHAGVDTVVAGAAVQSNYCRQLAAACAKLGLECHLVLRKVREGLDVLIQGNFLIDLIMGAKIEIIEACDWMDQAEQVRQKGKELEKKGRKVLVARVGDESGLGLYACAYAQACIEIVEQTDKLNLNIDEIWVCSSDTTQGGLAIALKHLESPIRLVGVPALVDPVTPGRTFPKCIAEIGNDCAEILGLSTRLSPEDIISNTDYVGPGYGIPTKESIEAIRLTGRSDGLLLDPVYTSKAMAGLIDHIRRGLIGSDKKILFLHTGGLPALFAYADSLKLEELI